MEAEYLAPEGGFSKHDSLADHWINETKILKKLSKQNQVAHTLWDAVANRFLFFNDTHGILGSNGTEAFTKQDGVQYFLSKIHPRYNKAVQLMYKLCLGHYKKQPQATRECLFQMDVLYQKESSECIQLLIQALAVETDQSGIPGLFLISIHDITYLKKENTSNLVITGDNQATIWNYSFDSRSLEQVRRFSTQEKRVLYYLSQKKGSKEIAGLLNTSPHTIDTQRRSLLQKTNCIDSTALIAYSRLTGILC